MLDDLDLAWEDQTEVRNRRGQPATRQQRQRQRRESKRRRRSWGALLISVLLLGTLGGGVYFGVGWVLDNFTAADYEGNPGKVEVLVVIKSGDSVDAIAQQLLDKKVVKSKDAFLDAAAADEDQGTNIQAGSYTLFEEMPAAIALSYLLDPDKHLAGTPVTIREGLTVIQTFKLLSEKTGIPVKDFQAAAKDPIKLGVQAWWYNRQDGKSADKSVEGFLFPATYRIDKSMKADKILSMMVDQFNTVVGELKFADKVQSDRGLSPYEALVVASIAQVEAGPIEGDLAKITRVAYNRLFKDWPCHCLQNDVVVNYWLEKQGKPTKNSGSMTLAELNDAKNPWNTGDKNPGIPLGPISNPGKAALTAAMAPADGPWFYFVVIDKKGTTAFAVTLKDHEKNIAKARANGVL